MCRNSQVNFPLFNGTKVTTKATNASVALEKCLKSNDGGLVDWSFRGQWAVLLVDEDQLTVLNLLLVYTKWALFVATAA